MNPNETDMMLKNREKRNGITEMLINSKNSGWIDIGGKKTWIEYFDELMNPKDNQFRLHTIESYNPNQINSDTDMHEVWTDSDCLFIRMSNFNINLTRRFGNDYTLVKDLIKKVTGKDAEQDFDARDDI